MLTKFTIENARQLISMLRSDDEESVELALRMMPRMDYENYPNIYKFILDITHEHWWANPRLKTSAEATVVARTLHWRHREQQLKGLHPCEVDIAKALVADHMQKTISDFLKGSDLQADIKVNYDDI